MRGATGRMLHDLARHFVKSGFKVTILATAARASLNSRGPISIVRIPGNDKPGIFGYIATLLRLYKAIMKLPRHDVIITMTDPPLLYVAGQRAAQKKNSRHIHWSQDVYPDLLPVLGFPVPRFVMNFAAALGLAALQSTDHVVAISRCMQRHLVRNGVSPRHISIVENWPDQELLASDTAKQDTPMATLQHARMLRDRRLYSDPTGQRFRVLYAGTIGRAHPVDAVVTAARILQKLQPDIELVFVGKGPGFDKLAQARAHFGLENIRLMPPQPRAALKALMDSGDVHLMTMRDDALGLLLPSKFYSALAAARPIVFAGPAECDIARLIAKHACGRVVKPHDGKMLATAIALYRTDSDAWFTAHEGAKTALVGRRPEDAFAAWSDVVKKQLRDV